MLRKSVKLVSLATLVMLMATILFVGCGKQTPATQDTTKPAVTTEATKAAEVAAPVVVTIKHYIHQDETAMKVGKVAEQIAEFEKENPTIKVDVEPLVANTSADDYTKKQDLMLASGEQMDVVYFKDVQTLTAKLAGNVIEPLDEIAQKLGVDLKGDYRGLIPFNGKFYAFPSQYSTWVTYINKDMLDAAGLPLPPADWTWDDYRDYAKKLTKGEGANKVYGSYMHNWEWFNAVGYQNKIVDNPFYKADGSANFDNPIFKTGLEYRYNLENVDKSQIPFMDIVTQKMAYRAIFFGGKAAMLPQGTWMLVDMRNKEKYPHTFKTVFATYPRADKDSPVNFSNNGGAGCGFGINANSKFKEETFKYLNFLTSKGMDIGQASLSPYRKGDHPGILKALMGSDESLYDMPSLLAILNDPNKKDNDYTKSPPYGVEITALFLEEAQKYFVGGQTIDECITNLQTRANDVIAKNKK